MWKIHDFPAYGFVVGCVSKGHKGCLTCDPKINGFIFQKYEEDGVHKS
jgi:hypothetical protein